MKTVADDELFTDIDENDQRLKTTIETWVEGKKKLKEGHREELDEYEGRMFAFLWRCRPILSTATLSRLVGMSRQTLYEKWQKHGFDVNEI